MREGEEVYKECNSSNQKIANPEPALQVSDKTIGNA